MAADNSQTKVSEKLWVEADDAIENENISLFDNVIKKLKSLKKINGEAYYLLGYLYYMHPDRSKKTMFKCISEKYLNKALKISNDKSINACCHLYKGHLLYDDLKFKKALQEFDLVDISSINSKFLQLKVYEFRLCSKINIDGLSNSLEELEEYNRVISKYPAVDISPGGLLILLSNIKENLDIKFFHSLKKILRKLDKIAKFDWFNGVAEDISN